MKRLLSIVTVLVVITLLSSCLGGAREDADDLKAWQDSVTAAQSASYDSAINAAMVYKEKVEQLIMEAQAEKEQREMASRASSSAKKSSPKPRPVTPPRSSSPKGEMKGSSTSKSEHGEREAEERARAEAERHDSGVMTSEAPVNMSLPPTNSTSEEPKTSTNTTPATDVVETPVTKSDTAPAKTETTSLVTHKTEGTLVYYCPSRMLENTQNNISVTISKAALKTAIEQLGEKVAATTQQSTETIKKDITGSSILIAAKMKVELKYGDKEFETIYKPENDDQIFNGTDDMSWDWIIKPTKVGPAHLSIIISAYDEKNGRWVAAQAPPRIFNIDVQVDPRGYLSKLWSFLESNPEWIFIQILFPVVAFFVGRSRGKKSKE